MEAAKKQDTKKAQAGDDEWETVTEIPHPAPGESPEADDEWETIDEHPTTTEDLLRAAGLGVGNALTAGLAQPLAEHVEASINTGFPEALLHLPGGVSAGKPLSAEYLAALRAAGDKNQQAFQHYPGTMLGLEAATSLLPAGAAKLMGSAVGETAENVAGSFERSANKRAFKAMGPYGDRSSGLKGLRPEIRDRRIQEIGETVRNEGILGGGLPKSYETLVDDLGAAKKKAGENLSEVIDRLSDAESKAAGNASAEAQAVSLPGQRAGKAGLSKSDLIESVLSEAMLDPGIPGASKHNAQIMETLQDWEKGLPDLIPLKRAEDLKRKVGGFIDWKKPTEDLSPTQYLNRVIYNHLQTGVEDAAEALSTLADGPTRNAFKDAKRRYGDLAQAESIASNREWKEFVNRMASPSDYGAGAVGALTGAMGGSSAIGTAAMGAVTGASNNFLRKYGNQIMSRTASAAADLAKVAPERFGKYADQIKYLRNQTPVAVQNGIMELMRESGFRAQATAIGANPAIDIEASDIPQVEHEIKTADHLNVEQKARMLSSLRKTGKLTDPELLVPNSEPVPIPQAGPNDFVQAMDRGRI